MLLSASSIFFYCLTCKIWNLPLSLCDHSSSFFLHLSAADENGLLIRKDLSDSADPFGPTLPEEQPLSDFNVLRIPNESEHD